MDDAQPPYLLSGLKVVDAATVMAAPAAAMVLADFGADVVKVEQPGSGDMLRMISGIRAMPGRASTTCGTWAPATSAASR